MKSIYIKIAFAVIVLVALFIFLKSIGSLVELLIISALLAFVLDPVANALEARGMSRPAATAVIFGAMGMVMVSFSLFAIPPMLRELEGLQKGASASQTQHILRQMQTLINQKLSFFGLDQINLADKVDEWKVEGSQRIMLYLVNDGVSLITHIVALPFIIFFLIKDGRAMKSTLLKMVPNRYFEFALNLMAKTDQQLGFYLRGQFLDATIFGLLSTLAMWILGVRYALFIGIFSGVANLIPYVGPLAGVTVATVITVVTTGEFVRVGYVLIAFILAKLLDDSLIQPIVVARSVDMHPLVVLLVVIIGGQFFGIMGMLLSVPATGILRVAIRESLSMVRRYNLYRAMG